MSSDPLPLPEIWSDLPDGTADESARSEFAVSGQSGLALIEYASGYAQPEPQPLARPPDRGEEPAANNERLPSLVPAALAKGLADLAAIVTQAEGLLRAQATLKGDAHFAVERIHDVAMALRMRRVDAALCDALDGSVREVGDALVRHEAAATGALSAGALLRDVVRRIDDLTVVASRTAAADAEPPVRSPATEAAATIEPPAPGIIDVGLDEPGRGAAAIGREDVQPPAPSASAEADTADGAQAEPADAPVARSLDDVTVDEEQVRSLRELVLNDESSEHAVSETQAIAAPPAAAPKIAAANDDAVEPVESQAPTLSDDEVATPAQTAIIAAANDEVVEPAESPAVVLSNDGVAAPEVVEPTGSTTMAAANDEVVGPTESMTAEVSEPQQAGNVALASLRVGESGTAAATKPHRPENDPLAALYGLSEEELIALFC